MNKYTLSLILVVLAIATASADLITVQSSKIEDRYQILKDIVYAVNNRNLQDANLGVDGSAKAKWITASDTVVVCSGAFNAVAASTTHTFSTPVQTIPAGKMAIFTLGVDADDVTVTKQSPVVSYSHQLVTPMLDEGQAILGTILIVADADGQFIPNTTLLDDASCTVTITDMHSLPLSLDLRQR
jgi:hypothetical protein